MAPFLQPVPVVQGIKERPDSLLVQGERLYIGTVAGNIHVFDIRNDGESVKTVLVSSKSLCRRTIEQLGYVKDINSIAVLSESMVTLYALPDFVPPTPLLQTKSAFSFAVHTSVQSVSSDGKVQSFDDAATVQAKGVPTVVTYLVVGCRRKLVVYSWRDGEAQEIKETPLPHSARVIAFLKPTVLCLAYSATEHAMFFLETMSTAELTLPISAIPTATAGGLGMNALSGLGGYMTLGLASKAKTLAVTVDEDVLIPRDGNGVFFAADGKARTQRSLIWPAPPDDLAVVKPYIISVLPPSTVPGSSLSEPLTSVVGQNGSITQPVLQFHSSISLQCVQSVVLALRNESTLTPISNHTLRLLTPSPSSKAPIFAVSTPSDRNAASTEGSAVWCIRMKSWAEQVNELVESEAYTDALALLDTIDKATLLDKDSRVSKIRALKAVAQFKQGQFDEAINSFIDLDINPAKVVALFPGSVSGRLHVAPDQWTPLFGGPNKPKSETVLPTIDTTVAGSITPSTSVVSSIQAKAKAVVDVTKQAVLREDDAVSVRARSKDRTKDDFTRSVETLLRYLSDRRPKVTGALAAVHITPSQSPQFPFLSETSVEDLLALPSTPLSTLTPEQLIRFAQIVDTALFKSYLIIRPGLLGPLCRIDNWCEVSEVEEVLQEREKFAELIFLYNGKKMHEKALKLLRKLSDKTSDVEEKVRPTISYVQKLGPEYLEQIFDSARWVYTNDPSLVLEIFTAEITEPPRSSVADFLEELDKKLCARYLEYLISDREETSTIFHDRLAELYLDMCMESKTRNASIDDFSKLYEKLLDFIQNTYIYRVDRLFGLLPSDDMFEARAILLGRLGKHEAALETYVYRLKDYLKAEEYCKSLHQPDSPVQDIFLTLLKIYLQPSNKQASLLDPALDLISRHGPRLNTLETLRLIPPLVSMKDVKAFLYDATREPIFDTKVVREIRKGRNEQVGRKLMALQSQRVKITDDRICPQCHKRIGNSVIAVHAPRGEVTHYQCREAFTRRRG